MRQTLFTPTYNRADKLPRLYDSVKKQTFKDFIWLIIDDGSTDNTKEVVRSFINEGVVNIRYVYKENGGKHTAMKMAWEIVETPYMIDMDSDDELLPDTLRTFEDEWIKIEHGGGKIARVLMFSKTTEGKHFGYGDFSFSKGRTYVDATWQEMVYNMHCHKEFIACSCVAKLKECFDFDKYTWHQETNRYLAEMIIWSSIGRRYQSRLLNRDGRIYHVDATNSIMRQEKNRLKELNDMTNAFYFLDENIQDFRRSPKYFLGFLASFIILGLKTDTSFREQWKHITSNRLKSLFVLFYVPFTAMYRLGLRRY